MSLTSLKWPDYVILAASLIASLGIGLYHSLTGGRQRTTQEFIMANRKLGILPTAISLFVSFQSAIVVLGTTAEMYQFGVQFMVWEPVALSLATLLTERLTIPWIYPLKLMSINDYLERRYESKAVRILGSVVGLIDGIIYMGISMYAPSAALESATGLPTKVSIPLMAIVSITYTAMGGMRAVIWTDVLQFLIFMGGVVAIFIKGLVVMGGYQNILDICDSEGRLDVADWSLDPTVRLTVWGFLFGRTISWARYSGLTQASVQRYSATESLSKARLVMLLNIPAICLLYFLTCSNGLTVFAHFSTIKCDPIVNKDVSTANQAAIFDLPLTLTSDSIRISPVVLLDPENMCAGVGIVFLSRIQGKVAEGFLLTSSGYEMAAKTVAWGLLSLFVMTIFSSWPGFAGLFLATLYGGALSSVSSYLSGSAAMCWDDILRLKLHSLPENKKAILNRLLVVVFGAAATAMAFLAAVVPGPVTQMSASFGNAVFGPVYGIFVMGGLSKYANWKGALIGGLGSLCINVWLNVGALTLSMPLPTLAPTSTAWCDSLVSANNTTWTTSTLSAQNSSVDLSGSTTVSFSYHANYTMSYVAHERNLVGIENFYALSYMWYSLFGILNTLIIGMTASLILRDRAAESRVSENLLISFYQALSWAISPRSSSLSSDTEISAKDSTIESIERVAVTKF